MTLIRNLTCCFILAAAAAHSPAQAVNFTGFVDVDFAGLTIKADPGGVDVAMPQIMNNQTSGWGIKALALHFDPATDTLYCGIDAFVVLGDADGDNAAGGTSNELAALGGTDHPDLGGTETFILVLDLDNDGNPDVIAGIPLGLDINGFKVSEYAQGIPLTSVFLAFGNHLPQHTGAVLGTPIPQCPDVEFTVPNFCELLNAYAVPGQEAIGAYVYMGSFDDATIGEDRMSGLTDGDMFEIPLSDFTNCLPIENNFDLRSIELLHNSVLQMDVWKVTTSYGVPEGFGCCLMISTVSNPGLYLPAPIDVTLLVGTSPADTFFVDLGGLPANAPCMCKEQEFYFPMGVEGITFYSQILSYRPNFDPNEAVNFFGSNRLSIGPTDYPSTGN